MAAVDTSRDIAAAAGKRVAVEQKAVRAVRRRVLPGLPLALGITLVYVAVIVVLPLAALIFKAASLGPADY